MIIGVILAVIGLAFIGEVTLLGVLLMLLVISLGVFLVVIGVTLLKHKHAQNDIQVSQPPPTNSVQPDKSSTFSWGKLGYYLALAAFILLLPIGLIVWQLLVNNPNVDNTNAWIVGSIPLMLALGGFIASIVGLTKDGKITWHAYAGLIIGLVVLLILTGILLALL